MLSLSFVVVAIAGSAAASPFQKRAAPACPDLLGYIGGSGGTASVIPFCSSYLGIRTQTVTQTSVTGTIEAVTTMSTIDTATTTRTVDLVTATARTTVVSQRTLDAPTITRTATTTQTAFLNNAGSTIAVQRRDAVPTAGADLAKRAIPTPTDLAHYNLNRADMSTACGCLSIPTPTITRYLKQRATSWRPMYLTRHLLKYTTAPAPTTTVVTSVTQVVNYLPAPSVAMTTALQVDKAYACPPNYHTTWSCPTGTSNDASDQPSELYCGVVAADGYQGECIYWNDDGSPAGSMLLKGDGSGDPDKDAHRDATYGDNDWNDCPRWADYTCQAPTTRLIREARDIARAAALEGRQNRLHSPHKTAAEYQAHVRNGLKPIPVPAPRRGGRFLGISGNPVRNGLVAVQKTIEGNTLHPVPTPLATAAAAAAPVRNGLGGLHPAV